MITLSNADSQIVLYAKGHFGCNLDHVESVRTLVAHRAGMLPKYISNRDIVIVLTMIMNDLKIKMFDASFIEKVIFGMYFLEKTQDPFQNFVSAALDLIRHTAVKGEYGETLIKLEPLDSSLLSAQTN